MKPKMYVPIISRLKAIQLIRSKESILQAENSIQILAVWRKDLLTQTNL